MRATFFGDSLTAGEGNDFKSFADYFNNDIDKGVLAISGTTVGEYSVYPVDGNSLLSVLYRKKDVVESSDVIILEYGVNDVSSIFLGNVTLTQAILAVVKALDLIKQVNPNAKIYWLKPVAEKEVINLYAENHVKYLFEDYLHGIRKVDEMSILRWSDTYEKLFYYISRLVKVIAGISKTSELQGAFVDDNIHFNDETHHKLAEILEKEILDYEGNQND